MTFMFVIWSHCSKSSFFVQKFNFDFPTTLSIFLGWKTRENVVVLDFFAVDNFDFTRKIVKKILDEKLVKMLGFCQNWILGQKFDFSNSVMKCKIMRLFSVISKHCNPDWKRDLIFLGIFLDIPAKKMHREGS